MTEWWTRHWFKEVSPHIFAALRIAIGLVGCMTMFGLLDVPFLLSPDGIAPPLGRGALGFREAIQRAGFGTAAGWVIWAANFAGFSLLLVGWKTPVASFSAFMASMGLIWWNPLPLSAGQHLLHMLTLYPLFADCGRVWSLDARRASRQGRPFVLTGQPIWPLRLLQYQLCVIYFSAALWKLLDPSWRDGTALHYILNYNAFQRVPGEVPPSLDPVLAAASYATIAWEALFAPAMFHPFTRRLALVTGAAMHLGMWALLDIGPFSLTVLAAYVAFLNPEEVRLFGERLRRPRIATHSGDRPEERAASFYGVAHFRPSVQLKVW